jgi:hypothetical protein
MSNSKPSKASPARIALRAAAVCVSALFAGCATFAPVPYTPQPARIADPATDVKAIITANAFPNCVVTPEILGQVLSVKYVCTPALGGRPSVGTVTTHLDRIQKITLYQSGESYRVIVYQSGEPASVGIDSKSLEDMQRYVDAITALAKPRPSPSNG